MKVTGGLTKPLGLDADSIREGIPRLDLSVGEPQLCEEACELPLDPAERLHRRRGHAALHHLLHHAADVAAHHPATGPIMSGARVPRRAAGGVGCGDATGDAG